MKKAFLVLIGFIMIGSTSISSQNIITLKECYELAYMSAPVSAGKDSYLGIWQIKTRILQKEWLPSLDAHGSFVYNSSVVDMSDVMGSLPVPGISDLIKPLPHEQYKVTLEINQLIYDGGTIQKAKKLESADFRINEKQVEVDLYKLRNQVNHCYFNILLLERQHELLNNFLSVIEKRMATVTSAIENGVVLKSDADVLMAEKIKTEQQLTENAIRKESLIKVLSELTGSEIDSSVKLEMPVVPADLSGEIMRPELQIFDLRKEQMNATMELIQSKRMPRVFGFTTLGFGNPPGSNFFRDEFAPFAIIGAGVKWNIFDWNKTADEKQIFSYQRQLIDSRKSDMEENINRLLVAKSAEIESLESLLDADIRIIELRNRISGTAESQYDNGTITATELILELNAEKQAKVNYEIHKINLVMAKVEHLNISGKELN